MQQAIAVDLSDFDRLLEHRSRFVICVLLRAERSLNFSVLKTTLEETDGNLGAQLRKLEDAGYLKVRKEFLQRKPVSNYSLTRKGRSALGRHIDAFMRLTEEFEP